MSFPKTFTNPILRLNEDFQTLYEQQTSFNRKSEIAVMQTKLSYQDAIYAINALGCLPMTNSFRQFIIQIVMNIWFERFILFHIACNCLFIAIDPKSESAMSEWLDIYFLLVFTIEMILKILAMGLIACENSYLRDYWNLLDILVVITGWIGLFSSGEGISVIRTFRLLRPLRSINSIPELKLLVNTLFNSIP